MSRAAAEIEPVSRMLSSSIALPGPMRAPDWRMMLTLRSAMRQYGTDNHVQAARASLLVRLGERLHLVVKPRRRSAVGRTLGAVGPNRVLLKGAAVEQRLHVLLRVAALNASVSNRSHGMMPVASPRPSDGRLHEREDGAEQQSRRSHDVPRVCSSDRRMRHPHTALTVAG